MIARDTSGQFLPGAPANPHGRPCRAKAEHPLGAELQDLVLALAGRKVVVREKGHRARAMTLFEARVRALPRSSGRERQATWSFIRLAYKAAREAEPRRRAEQVNHVHAVLQWAIGHGTDAEFDDALADQIALQPHPGDLRDDELALALRSARHWVAKNRSGDSC